jgi:hypothetical protein
VELRVQVPGRLPSSSLYRLEDVRLTNPDRRLDRWRRSLGEQGVGHDRQQGAHGRRVNLSVVGDGRHAHHQATNVG